MAAWLDLAALVAADPATNWRSVVVGCAEKQGRLKTLELVGRGGTCDDRHGRALDALEVAVDCYRRGLREPIPLFASISYKLHERTAKPSDWESFDGHADGQDDANRLAFGDLGFEDLCALPALRRRPPGIVGGTSGTVRRLPVGHDRGDRRGAHMSAPPVFSLLDPLPSGCVAIEASAGTGKTYTLAGLVVRYVAEEAVRVEELLIVTFTRAAAAELRDRVRSRLSEAAAALQPAL